MPDKPLEGQGTSEDISILWGEGTEREKMEEEKERKGESDCEDGRGRGCREEGKGYWDWLTPLVPGMNWLLSFSRICLVTMGH